MGIIQFRTEPRTACPGWRPVHPHVRGDSPCVGMLQTFRAGSPPRAWGQPGHSTVSPPVIRFTPTCVGTALPWCGVPSPIPVHPHVRGDSLKPTTRSMRWEGSPPRAWGQLIAITTKKPSDRFTPTCVGTARRGFASPDVLWVHPHVRGDSPVREARFWLGYGSPPRAWGQRHPVQRAARRQGFTPTCVGTARPARTTRSARAVHPHVRGDSVPYRSNASPASGSPPRAWAQRTSLLRPRSQPGFTPTCVGTAAVASIAAPPARVHPHVRGDSNRWPYTEGRLVGSPPRAWGQRRLRPPEESRKRFTPTCVGTATRHGWPIRFLAVHPHVRGDSHSMMSPRTITGGSPPRAWGQPA